MSQALYRKWRPHHWGQVIGQDHVVQTLKNAVLTDRVAHAYLFAGPRGTGKTTTARLLAKAVNCLDADPANRPCDECEHCLAVNQGRFLDLIEIDAASNTSVEDVRDLREKINFSPNQGKYKVYIVDEVHMLSTAAFNALLKTLEEPPAHAIFILATTEIHKIPATVLSRCQRHEFRRIPVSDIVSQLKEMAESEGIQAEDEALTLVARQATGSMRDAISLLDQLASSGKTINLEMAQTLLGTATSQVVLELVDAVVAKDSARGLDEVHRALDAGSDPRQFARQIVEYLRSLLLVRMGNAGLVDASPDVRHQMAQHAQSFDVGDLLRVIRLFNQAAYDARSNWQPALPLEMAFIDSLGEEKAEEPVSPPKRSGAPQVEKSAPAKEPAVEQEETAEDEGGLTLKMVREQWKPLMAAIRRKSPNAEALLKSGKVLGIKNGAVYLGFSEVLKSKMEKSENIESVRQAFQEIFNIEIPIHCVVATGKAGAMPADVESDGMVATALRDLGGEIVDLH